MRGNRGGGGGGDLVSQGGVGEGVVVGGRMVGCVGGESKGNTEVESGYSVIMGLGRWGRL